MRYRGAFLILLLFVLVISLLSNQVKADILDTDCSLEYEPVCGNNGFTYDNECIATKLAGVEVLCQGACPCREDSVPCSDYFSPVCGKDGRTYGNTCVANQFGIKIACVGKCPCKGQQAFDEISCERVYKPVCGSNNITYANECYAKSFANTDIECSRECPCEEVQTPEESKNEQEVATEEIIKEDESQEVIKEETEEKPRGSPIIGASTDCATFEFSPVCDTNEKTHPNSCFAIQSNLEIKCEGVCPCEEEAPQNLFNKLWQTLKRLII